MPLNHAYSFSNQSSMSILDESYEPPPNDRGEAGSFGNGIREYEERPDPDESFLSANESSREFHNSIPSSLNATQEDDDDGQDQPMRLVNTRDSHDSIGRSGVICSNPEYYLQPSIEELDLKTDVDGNCFIRGFVVGRHNYGQVKYLDVVNVAGINIDKTGEYFFLLLCLSFVIFQ